jgi:hypothetical protein
MSAGFLSFLSKPSPGRKLFIAIMVLAIAARLFALAYMPDPAMSDSLHHLTISRYIIQNRALPFEGIPGTGVEAMPPPLYHLIVAIPFMLLPLSLTLETVRVFPIIFSALQVLLTFLVTRKLFPKYWHIGLAFAAFHPLLVIFGAVNMPDTLASVFVLLSFYLYLKFRENPSKKILFIAPFSLAAMVLSKENAALVLPAFFLAFLFEVWRARTKDLKKASVFFLVATVVLSSLFVPFVPTGAIQPSEFEQPKLFLESAVLLPLNFNASFWFFLEQGFSGTPFGISKEIAFVAFSLVTFPITFFLLFGLLKAALKRQAYALLLLACLALSSVLLLLRSEWTIYSRMLIPIMPLLGLGLCQSFKDFSVKNWRRLFLIFFSLTALYCLAFSSLYVNHFWQDHEDHVPLYNHLKELPGESVIALHPNKARAIAFITGKQYVSYSEFYSLAGAEETFAKLKELNVTHLASTCYKQQWDQQVLKQLEQGEKLGTVYQDSCSTLYQVR